MLSSVFSGYQCSLQRDEVTVVGQAAVQEFRIIYTLLSTYLHKRIRRDMQQKCLPKGLLLSGQNHAEERGKDSETR